MKKKTDVVGAFFQTQQAPDHKPMIDEVKKRDKNVEKKEIEKKDAKKDEKKIERRGRPKKKEPRKTLIKKTFRMSPELNEAFNDLVEKTNKTHQELISSAISVYIEKHKK